MIIITIIIIIIFIIYLDERNVGPKALLIKN